MLQRIEMEIQGNVENICVVFVDAQSSGDKDEIVRQTFFDICRSGDFIKNYSHLKNSLSIEHSHHSVGIQMADSIAGVFNGFLKGYIFSTELFRKRLQPYLRKSPSGNYEGYGIIEIPTNEFFRKEIKTKISTAILEGAEP
jgi:hypothetical protein